MYFHEVSEDGPFNFKHIEAWRKPPPKRLRVYKVRCYIYQAESLPPCDDTGASDPYIEVWTPDDQSVKTDCCEQTNNPIYYETKEIQMEFWELGDAPPIILNFFDTDQGFLDSEDDYIGRAVVFLKDLAALGRGDDIPKPEWYPVKYAMGDAWEEANGARVLVSFAYKEHDDEPFQLAPETIELEK